MLNLMVLPDATGMSFSSPNRHDRNAPERIVLFRADAVEGRQRITAVFPCEAAMGDQMAGFSAEEGNVSCCRLWFDMSRPAKETEYRALATQLEAKGFKLDIRHRVTPAMETTRAFAAKLQPGTSGNGKPHRKPRKAKQADRPALYAVPDGLNLQRPVVRRDGTEGLYYSRDAFGVLRCGEGIPQTLPGTATPLGYVELGEDTPAMMAGFQVACGLAAAAWAKVSGRATVEGREVVLCLVEEVCDTHPDHITETFALAPHELDTARDRVAKRLATDLVFANQYSRADAMMKAGCAFFPWSRGDGRIPG